MFASIPLLRKTLTRKDKIKVLALTLMIGFGSSMEGVMLAAFYLLFKLLNNPENVHSSQYLSSVYNFLGQPPLEILILEFILILCIIVLAKNLFITTSYYLWRKFLVYFSIMISVRIFKKFVLQPYLFHLNNGEVKLRNYFEGGGLMTNQLMWYLSSIVQDIIALTALTVILFRIDISATTIIILLSSLLLTLALKYLGKKLKLLASTRVKAFAEINQTIVKTIGGIKEIELLNRKKTFASKMEQDSKVFYRAEHGRVFYDIVMKPIFETILMLVLSITMVVLIYQDKTSQLMPIMGSYAVAGIRILPMFSRLSANINNVGFISVTIEKLNEIIFKKIPKPLKDTQKIDFNNNIALRDIEYRYSNKSPVVLDIKELTVKNGEMVGFIGKSGAGKSTLVDIILGLLPLDKGRVEVDGVSISDNPVYWQKQIGYVPQSIYLADDSIKNNVAFGIEEDEIDEEQVIAALKKAQIFELVDKMPDKLDSVVGERGVKLSGGQRQRIGIARALYHNPPVLCLDEATSALDSYTEKKLMKSILELQGKLTILIIAHRLNTVERCDKIYQLENGRIINSGNYAKIMAKKSPTTDKAQQKPT